MSITDAGTEELRIGRRQVSGVNQDPFVGIIDSVTFVPRALSEDEINNFNAVVESLR